LRGTIDGLMQVFSDLDGAISRVARLRATVKNERSRLAQMLGWLEAHEREVYSNRPAMAPPSPMATAMALAEVPLVPGLDLEADRKRLVLAKGFLKKMVNQSSGATSLDHVADLEVAKENYLASDARQKFDSAFMIQVLKPFKPGNTWWDHQ